MAGLDGFDEVVSSVVYASNDVSITLGVGSPENNNLIQFVLCLEVTII